MVAQQRREAKKSRGIVFLTPLPNEVYHVVVPRFRHNPVEKAPRKAECRRARLYPELHAYAFLNSGTRCFWLWRIAKYRSYSCRYTYEASGMPPQRCPVSAPRQYPLLHIG